MFSEHRTYHLLRNYNQSESFNASATPRTAYDQALQHKWCHPMPPSPYGNQPRDGETNHYGNSMPSTREHIDGSQGTQIQSLGPKITKPPLCGTGEKECNPKDLHCQYVNSTMQGVGATGKCMNNSKKECWNTKNGTDEMKCHTFGQDEYVLCFAPGHPEKIEDENHWVSFWRNATCSRPASFDPNSGLQKGSETGGMSNGAGGRVWMNESMSPPAHGSESNVGIDGLADYYCLYRQDDTCYCDSPHNDTCTRMWPPGVKKKGSCEDCKRGCGSPFDC